jgi:hypothetical protein
MQDLFAAIMDGSYYDLRQRKQAVNFPVGKAWPGPFWSSYASKKNSGSDE